MKRSQLTQKVERLRGTVAYYAKNLDEVRAKLARVERVIAAAAGDETLDVVNFTRRREKLHRTAEFYASKLTEFEVQLAATEGDLVAAPREFPGRTRAQVEACIGFLPIRVAFATEGQAESWMKILKKRGLIEVTRCGSAVSVRSPESTREQPLTLPEGVTWDTSDAAPPSCEP